MIPLHEFHRKYYDRFVGQERDLKAQVDWLDSLFKKQGVETVLDCGCGTGAHAIRLAERGYDVEAFDYSEGQIEQAREKADKSGVDITFHQADIRDLDFGKFDAVISLYAVIMFACKGKEDLRKAVESMKNSLNEDGICFFETCTPKQLNLPTVEAESKETEDGTKVALVKFREHQPEENYTDMQRAYLVKEKDRDLEVTKTKSRYDYFTREDVLSVFEELGIEPIKIYGNFDNEEGKYAEFKDSDSVFISPLFKKN